MLTGVNLFLSVIMMKQNVISFVFRYPVIRAVKGLKGDQNIFLHEGVWEGGGVGGRCGIEIHRGLTFSLKSIIPRFFHQIILIPPTSPSKSLIFLGIFPLNVPYLSPFNHNL